MINQDFLGILAIFDISRNTHKQLIIIIHKHIIHAAIKQQTINNVLDTVLGLLGEFINTGNSIAITIFDIQVAQLTNSNHLADNIHIN
jgi:hypothetical protein